jgi:F420-non-reducing hydrogenase iron-sulfur subunit
MGKKRNRFSPKIVAFCCFHSAYQAADNAGAMRNSYSDGIYIIRVPCAGKVEGLHILQAFEKGADGVLIMACPEESCHYLSGNIRAKKRVAHILPLLEEIGLEAERLKIFNLASNQAHRFVQLVNEIAEMIKNLGPSPIKAADMGR